MEADRYSFGAGCGRRAGSSWTCCCGGGRSASATRIGMSLWRMDRSGWVVAWRIGWWVAWNPFCWGWWGGYAGQTTTASRELAIEPRRTGPQFAISEIETLRILVLEATTGTGTPRHCIPIILIAISRTWWAATTLITWRWTWVRAVWRGACCRHRRTSIKLFQCANSSTWISATI